MSYAGGDYTTGAQQTRWSATPAWALYSLITKADTFNKCVKINETTPLEPDALRFIVPVLQLVKDGPAELVEYGFNIDDD